MWHHVNIVASHRTLPYMETSIWKNRWMNKTKLTNWHINLTDWQIDDKNIQKVTYWTRRKYSTPDVGGMSRSKSSPPTVSIRNAGSGSSFSSSDIIVELKNDLFFEFSEFWRHGLRLGDNRWQYQITMLNAVFHRGGSSSWGRLSPHRAAAAWRGPCRWTSVTKPSLAVLAVVKNIDYGGLC